MPRNKSEKVPGRKEIIAYGAALREELNCAGSGYDFTMLWRAIPLDARSELISGVSGSMGGPSFSLSDMTTRDIRELYAAHIEKTYAT